MMHLAAAGASVEMDEPLRHFLLADASVQSQEVHADAGEKQVHFAPVLRRETRNCLDPWTVAFLQSNGNVRPCCFMDASFGELAKQSLDEIYAGADFVRLRTELLTGELRPSCRTCHAREVVDVSVLRNNVAARLHPS
jgi:radical SAM protein with 4Fe4S-binding SPASM domain